MLRHEQSAESKYKSKVRSRVSWKKLKEEYRKLQKNKCAVTDARLTKTAQLHHLDLDIAHYEDFASGNFVLLSVTAHDFVHWLWGKGNNNWRLRLQRISEILEKMEKINRKVDTST